MTLAIPRTLDDEIAAARDQGRALEAELAARRDAAASAQAELDQLGAREPEARSGRRGEHMALWVKNREAAFRRHSKAIDRIRDLERLGAEAALWARQLEARRIPAVDDAIALSKGNLADLEDVSARNVAALAQRRARLRELDVDAALGDAGATRARDQVAAEIEDLEEAQRFIAKDRDRVAGALGGLLERRSVAVVVAGQARTAAAQDAWRGLQVTLAQAARTFAAAGAQLVVLAAEHPNLMSLVDRHATLWGDDDLAVIVRSADYLALRDRSG